ncbi:helix-turn-helix domain-containing protein [Xanthomonas campestris pv. phormiicola]|nr:helix-turn-helix domain-containing protein [Xanthomonas campestris pv. phormiicola]UYC17404.1 helix-turn-helix domain-containing protein [Xanthomonas campestris pv. phormiicola]
MRVKGGGVHPVDRHIGQQIRLCRIQSDVSQVSLAEGIGVTFQQVQKYESGKNRVSGSMLYDIAGHLRVPVASFFEGLPEPGSGELSDIAPKSSKLIAYIATNEGRDFIGHLLQLPPRVRSRLLSFVGVLTEER